MLVLGYFARFVGLLLLLEVPILFIPIGIDIVLTHYRENGLQGLPPHPRPSWMFHGSGLLSYMLMVVPLYALFCVVRSGSEGAVFTGNMAIAHLVCILLGIAINVWVLYSGSLFGP